MCWIDIFGTPEKQTDHRNLTKRNPLAMRIVKNLFLYFLNFYTLAIVPLRSALSTITALPRLLQTDQQATLLNALIIPEKFIQI